MILDERRGEMRSLVIASVIAVTMLHSFLLADGHIGPSIGICGMVMQLLFSQVLDDFPNMNVKSIKFIMVCGK